MKGGGGGGGGGGQSILCYYCAVYCTSYENNTVRYCAVTYCTVRLT